MKFDKKQDLIQKLRCIDEHIKSVEAKRFQSPIKKSFILMHRIAPECIAKNDNQEFEKE